MMTPLFAVEIEIHHYQNGKVLYLHGWIDDENHMRNRVQFILFIIRSLHYNVCIITQYITRKISI